MKGYGLNYVRILYVINCYNITKTKEEYNMFGRKEQKEIEMFCREFMGNNFWDSLYWYQKLIQRYMRNIKI